MTYRIRSEDVWNKARQDYLDGDPALAVCTRYDLGLSALRKRARQEGWRRADRPDPLIEHDAPMQVRDADIDEMLDEALRRSLDLAADGRVEQAGRWLRYHRGLQAVHDDDVKLQRALDKPHTLGTPQALMLAMRESVHQCTFSNASAPSLPGPQRSAAEALAKGSRTSSDPD